MPTIRPCRCSSRGGARPGRIDRGRTLGTTARTASTTHLQSGSPTRRIGRRSGRPSIWPTSAARFRSTAMPGSTVPVRSAPSGGSPPEASTLASAKIRRTPVEAAESSIVAPTKCNRRRFSCQYKARLVALATQGEHSVSQVAIDHQLNVNMLRKWIRLASGPPPPAPMVPIHVTSAPTPRPEVRVRAGGDAAGRDAAPLPRVRSRGARAAAVGGPLISAPAGRGSGSPPASRT